MTPGEPVRLRCSLSHVAGHSLPAGSVRRIGRVFDTSAGPRVSLLDDAGKVAMIQVDPEDLEPVSSGNPKDLIGSRKPDLSLIPPSALVLDALVMADGARKYGPYNWREKPVRARCYVAAALRHLLAYLDGEDNATDSGLSHLAHARAGIGILIDAIETGNVIDDRPLPGAASRLIRENTA